MEVGLFQLENLLSIRNQFVFLDVRKKYEDWPRELKNVLQGAQFSNEPKEFLIKNKIPSQTPVILIDEDGRSTVEIARALEAAGYKHIYTVVDGLAGLISEL